MKLLISLSAVNLDARDIKRIEADPVGLAKILYTADLVSILKQSSARYYNDGTSLISDKAFDALKDELAERKPTHPFLQTVGAPVAKGSRKVKLPFPLFSLDKIKPESVTKWAAANPGPYNITDKEDGNSLEIVYSRTGVQIFTRGDGTMGQDITFLAPHLDIPKSVPTGKRFAVRAEAIMPQASFNNLFKGTYSNPRNLVAGAMNKRVVHTAIPHIHVIAYEIIEPRMKPSESMLKLKQLGFNVVPNKVFKTITPEQLTKLLHTRKAKSKYEIDGLVIEQDTVNKRPSAGTNPSYAVAFKRAEEDSMSEAKVLEVIWEASKNGALKPRIRIQPTILSGVTVNFATGHNAYFVEHGFRKKDEASGLPTRPIGPGAIVKVIRSGDVIPHIVSVVKGSTRPSMPSEEYKYGRTGIDIYQTVTSDLTKEKRIAAFFTTVGVDYLRLSTVQKLVQNGLDTIPKILRAKPQDFLAVPGYKDTMAQKLHTAIQSKTREVELHTLMDASGAFGAGLGEKRMKPLVAKYPTIMTWTNLTAAQIEQRVVAVPGFNTLAKQFALGFPKFVKWLATTRIKPILPTKIKVMSTKLSGQSVAFTGFRDPDLEATIISNGGQVASGVSAKTTILLVKSKAAGSSKLTKAAALGIKIMTADEFNRKFKL